MSNLQTIPGIGKSSIELLEAAGYLDDVSLAQADLDELVTELSRANSVLKILKRAPRRGDIGKWQAIARERIGTDLPENEASKEEPPPLTPVNYEGNAEVSAMLAKAPAALPLPPRLLIEQNIAVSDIPPAILLNRIVGDLDVRMTESASGKPVKSTNQGNVNRFQAIPERESKNQSEGEQAPKRQIDVSRIRSISDMVQQGSVRVAATSPSDGQVDRVTLLRAPREKTNRGRNPESRWYIRGVLHTHPYQIAMGAFSALLVILAVPLAIVSATLLLLSDLNPETFSWVPKWFLVFPFFLMISGVIYLIWGLGSGKCRICGQRLFIPKNCLKNSKAHHIPVIGYILPTALHLLIFRWFRCTYCGTPVRIKE
jgi:hypothetical protein